MEAPPGNMNENSVRGSTPNNSKLMVDLHQQAPQASHSRTVELLKSTYGWHFKKYANDLKNIVIFSSSSLIFESSDYHAQIG